MQGKHNAEQIDKSAIGVMGTRRVRRGPGHGGGPGLLPRQDIPYFDWDWSGVYVGASVGVTQALGGAGITYSNIDPDLGSGPNGSFANGMYSSDEVVGNYLNDYSVVPPGYVLVPSTGTSTGSLTGNNLGVTNTPLTPWPESVPAGDLGVVGSLRAGANMQFGAVVFGVELDASLLDQVTELQHTIAEDAILAVNQSAVDEDPFDEFPLDALNYNYDSTYEQDGSFSYRAEVANLLTARARVGFAADRTLFFVTGGLAAGEVHQETSAQVSETSTNTNQGNIANETADGVNNAVNQVTWEGSSSEFRVGYAVGGGVSHAVTDHLVLTLDGYYYDLGVQSVTATDNHGETSYEISQKFDGYLVRVGAEVLF
jgi:opacity protein-like surface antigen